MSSPFSPCAWTTCCYSGDRKLHATRKGKLTRYFHRDIRDVKLVLGVQMTRDRRSGTPTITQANHTKSMLEKFGMANCNPLRTPGVES